MKKKNKHIHMGAGCCAHTEEMVALREKSPTSALTARQATDPADTCITPHFAYETGPERSRGSLAARKGVLVTS